jgi:hypothetical protein
VLALRATFFRPNNPVKGVTSHSIGYANFYQATGGSYASKEVILVPVEVYAVDDWFIGTQTMPQAISGTGVQRIMFTQCCRISTLLQSNNDATGTIWANMDPRESSGPASTGLAREYFFVNQPVNYIVPAVSPLNRDFKFTIPTTADTGLPSTYPTGTNPVFSVDQATGRFNWTPSRTGLYAIQIRCQDGRWAGNVFTATNNFIPVDFIMEVLTPCALSNPSCNRPPYLVKDLTCGAANPVLLPCLLPFEKNFFRGVEGTYQIFGKDDNV